MSAYCKKSINNLDDSEDESSSWDSEGLSDRESSKTGLFKDEEDQFATDILQVGIIQDYGMTRSVVRKEADEDQSMNEILSYAAVRREIILKTAHPDLFNGEAAKTRLFMQQIDNKTADVANTISGRKIRYAMSLLRETAAK